MGGEGSSYIPFVFETENGGGCKPNPEVVLPVGFLGTVEVAAENIDVVDLGFSVWGGSLETTGLGVFSASAANIFVGGAPLGVVLPFMKGCCFNGDSKRGRFGALAGDWIDDGAGSFSLKLSPLDTNVGVEVAAAMPLFWRWRFGALGPDPSSSVPSSTAFLFVLEMSFIISSRLVL